MRVLSLVGPLALANAVLALLRRDEEGLLTSTAGANSASKRYIIEFAEVKSHIPESPRAES